MFGEGFFKFSDQIMIMLHFENNIRIPTIQSCVDRVQCKVHQTYSAAPCSNKSTKLDVILMVPK